MDQYYSTAQLIAALRCTCTVPTIEPDCAACPFAIKERLNDHNWISCDVDSIGLLAADRLEQLKQ